MSKDFGGGYVEFWPAVSGKTKCGLRADKSEARLDGCFTAEQLRNIADELERQEAQMREENEEH